MENQQFTLEILSGRFAVCRLPADAAIPAWAGGAFFSLTRTPDELSLVCLKELVPEEIPCACGWRCLRVAGTLDLNLVGVLTSLAAPLAQAGVSIFALSTFDTDYLLVSEADLGRAAQALREEGHVLPDDV
jgi:hypothetical protein